MSDKKTIYGDELERLVTHIKVSQKKTLFQEKVEKILINLRRKFNNVYPEFKTSNRCSSEISLTGRFVVEHRIFKNWIEFRDFAKENDCDV